MGIPIIIKCFLIQRVSYMKLFKVVYIVIDFLPFSNESSYLTEWEVTESETESETHSETQSETQSDITTNDSDDQPPLSKKLKMALTKEAVVELLKKKPLSIPTMVSIIKAWNTGLGANYIGRKLEEILKTSR